MRIGMARPARPTRPDPDTARVTPVAWWSVPSAPSVSIDVSSCAYVLEEGALEVKLMQTASLFAIFLF